MTDTLLQIILLVPALIVAIVFHEVAHGWVALQLGDTTARDLNRLSLNPIRHVDPMGTLIVPGLLALSGGPVFGWAKPVPVVKARLRNPRYGMMAVAAAGPLMNFILAFIGAVTLGLLAPSLGAGVGGEPGYFTQALVYFILINTYLGVFNLLPIPPFDGSHILEGLLPPSMAASFNRLRPYGMMFFFGLVAIEWIVPGLGLLQNTIGVPATWAIEQYFAIAAAIAGA